MKTREVHADLAVIGSGVGGATLAYGVAAKNTNPKILILERGDYLQDSPECADVRAIFRRGYFRNSEDWYDTDGKPFNAGNYYYVGGNSKFYGAVMLRYRKQDFGGISYPDGDTRAWPFGYDELESYYARAEQLFAVRGTSGADPTEPPRSGPYDLPPVPDEADIARVRAKLKELGLHPFSLPLAVDIDEWLKHQQTPWDAFPNTGDGKTDAQNGPLKRALAYENTQLITQTTVRRLLTDKSGKKVVAAECVSKGEDLRVVANTFVLSAGAVQSASLLLGSADEKNPRGLANRSDAVGRYFMNHNTGALLAIDPRRRNRAVYQKTVGFNDFYLNDGKGGHPLGNVQLLGKITPPILKTALPYVPESALRLITNYSVDWYLMSEDLPDPDSRVRLDGNRIVLEWKRSNMQVYRRLEDQVRAVMRAAGYPLVLTREFDRRVPSHQCGTVRFGKDPWQDPLDHLCRSFDHPNLYVVDASFLPTSAAVNPALTIAAQALRVGEHLANELRS